MIRSLGLARSYPVGEVPTLSTVGGTEKVFTPCQIDAGSSSSSSSEGVPVDEPHDDLDDTFAGRKVAPADEQVDEPTAEHAFPEPLNATDSSQSTEQQQQQQIKPRASELKMPRAQQQAMPHTGQGLPPDLANLRTVDDLRRLTLEQWETMFNLDPRYVRSCYDLEDYLISEDLFSALGIEAAWVPRLRAMQKSYVARLQGSSAASKAFQQQTDGFAKRAAKRNVSAQRDPDVRPASEGVEAFLKYDVPRAVNPEGLKGGANKEAYAQSKQQTPLSGQGMGSLSTNYDETTPIDPDLLSHLVEMCDQWRINDHIKAGGKALETPAGENWQTWQLKSNTTNAALNDLPMFDYSKIKYCERFDYDSVPFGPIKQTAETRNANTTEQTAKPYPKTSPTLHDLKPEDFVPEKKFIATYDNWGNLVLREDEAMQGMEPRLQKYAAMKGFDEDDDAEFFPAGESHVATSSSEDRSMPIKRPVPTYSQSRSGRRDSEVIAHMSMTPQHASLPEQRQNFSSYSHVNPAIARINAQAPVFFPNTSPTRERSTSESDSEGVLWGPVATHTGVGYLHSDLQEGKEALHAQQQLRGDRWPGSDLQDNTTHATESQRPSRSALFRESRSGMAPANTQSGVPRPAMNSLNMLRSLPNGQPTAYSPTYGYPSAERDMSKHPHFGSATAIDSHHQSLLGMFKEAAAPKTDSVSSNSSWPELPKRFYH